MLLNKIFVKQRNVSLYITDFVIINLSLNFYNKKLSCSIVLIIIMNVISNSYFAKKN